VFLAHFYKKRNDYLLYVNLLLHMQKISSILSSKPKQTFQQEQTYQVNKKTHTSTRPAKD